MTYWVCYKRRIVGKKNLHPRNQEKGNHFSAKRVQALHHYWLKMFSRGFGKLCFVAALVEVLLGWNSVYSSSIYVGRHEAGTYTEEKPSEGVLSEVSCADGNKRLCNKIINFYGADVCNTHDESLLNAIQGVCQATCGFCTPNECEDEFPDICKDYGGYCENQGDFGGLIRDICPKTCSTCHLKPRKGQSNLVVING